MMAPMALRTALSALWRHARGPRTLRYGALLVGAWLLVVLGLPSPALAYLYPVPLGEVQTEEDLYEVYYEGNLSEAELEQLLSLLRDPVDLNAADRETIFDLPGMTWPLVDELLKARESSGTFKSMDDLALVPGISEEVLAELATFAETRRPAKTTDRVRSKWELKVGWDPLPPYGSRPADELATSQHRAPPAAYLRGDAEILRWLSLGFAATESMELGPLDYNAAVPVYKDGYYDGDAPGYLTDGRQTRFDLAKIYLHTPQGRHSLWSAIVGSYRMGFGLGLTFDNTSREFPNGWRVDREIDRAESITQTSAIRYRDRPGLFGAAASLHAMDLGPVALTAHGFVSSTRRNSYQKLRRDDDTSMYICERSPETGECDYREDPATAVPGFFGSGDGIYKLSTETLLDAFRENTVGGSTTIHLGGGAFVGTAAYYSTLEILLEPADHLEFSDSASYDPDGSSFGAVGVFGGWGTSGLRLRAEVTRMYSGGNAAWLRTFYEQGPVDVEVGLRYYDEHYTNPWTSPYAEGDQLDGHRARDELGANYALRVRPMQGLSLRLKGDVWRQNYARCTLTREPDSSEFEKGDDCLAMEEALGRLDLKPSDYLELEPLLNTSHSLTATYQPRKWIRLTLRPSYTDHDVGTGGREETYGDGGSGLKLSLYGKLDVEPVRWLRLSLAYRHGWEDDRGPKEIFDPTVYADQKDLPWVPGDGSDPWKGNTSKQPVDAADPDATLYQDSFRQDRYAYAEVRARLADTTGTLRLKVNEEAIGEPALTSTEGSYWMLTAKLAQARTLGLFSASLRYDLLRFTDQRVKWYQEDRRPDNAGRLLLSRNNHQLIATLGLSF